jgi:hypothetical protein
MIVGEGIDTGKTLPHELALQPLARVAFDHVHLRKRIAMAVGTGAAESEFDLGT